MIAPEILGFYAMGNEEGRLRTSIGRLEFIRTWEIRVEAEPSLLGANPHLVAIA